MSMARRRKMPRKDALLVFLVLLVAGLLVERFGGDEFPCSHTGRTGFAHLSVCDTFVEKAFFHLFERVVMGVFHHSVRHINDFGFIVIDPFGVFGILDLVVEWFCEQIRPAETRRNQREKHIPACRSFPAAKGTLIIFPHHTESIFSCNLVAENAVGFRTFQRRNQIFQVLIVLRNGIGVIENNKFAPGLTYHMVEGFARHIFPCRRSNTPQLRYTCQIFSSTVCGMVIAGDDLHGIVNILCQQSFDGGAYILDIVVGTHQNGNHASPFRQCCNAASTLGNISNTR